jgi:hypothetical protein
MGQDAFDNTAWYNSQGDGVVYIDHILYTYKGTMPPGTTISIELGTVCIGDYPFTAHNELTGVTTPNTGLTIIIIPNSVTTSIPDFAFAFCDNLTTVTIGNGVTSIGQSAFYQCTSLTVSILSFFPRKPKHFAGPHHSIV